MLFNLAQSDRAAGVLLGLACGDALGAGYRSGGPVPDDEFVTMTGGGSAGRTPGEWSDDTSMAIPITRAAAAGHDLRDEAVLADIARQWVEVGGAAPSRGRNAGSASLMRTAPVALGYLEDPDALAEAARTLSDLTDDRADAGDACVLWSLAVRHAIWNGELQLRAGLDALPADRRELWLARIEEAEHLPLSAFVRTDEAVSALQGAWSSLTHLFVVPEIGQTDADYLRQCIENAVQDGPGSGNVAALTGGLAGARWGASAVPAEWRRIVHGSPGLRATDLVRLSALAANGGAPDADGWPTAERFEYAAHGDLSALVRHPHDDGVWLGAVGALDALPDEVDAVISLCRVGSAQVPARILDHIEVWMLEDEDPENNPNLDFVLVDTVDEIAALRAEGHVVLVHCVQGQCCTATIAALYASRHRGVPMARAMADIELALPGSHRSPAGAAESGTSDDSD